MATVNTRAIVLDILMEVLEKGRYSHLIINSVLDKYMYLGKTERSFIKRLSEGSIESLIEIDYVINLYSKTPVKKMKPEIRNILRLSVYQILHMDSVPDHSACDEAVKLTLATKKYRNLKGFVNGVLRTICREKDNITYPDDAIRYSLPEWIKDQWEDQYGQKNCDLMLKSLKEPRPITIRPGYGITKDQLAKNLSDEGLTVTDAPYVEDALTISGFDSITELDSFRKGEFYIQDVSSMLVGIVADPKENDTVLDVCAAPGGKSLHLASLMKNTGQILARDVSKTKVDLLTENFIRSGFKNLSAEVFDATVHDESMVGQNDIVLCDLPCSGLGIIGRKSDIKYNMNLKAQEDLVALQRQILTTVWDYVKLNGKLIYSTCTTNLYENLENVRWFVENFPFRVEDIKGRVAEDIVKKDEIGEYIQLLPGINPCDGFFICSLRRI